MTIEHEVKLARMRAKCGAQMIDTLTEYDFANGRQATIACALGMLDGLLDWMEQATGSRATYEDIQRRADVIASEVAKVTVLRSGGGVGPQIG